MTEFWCMGEEFIGVGGAVPDQPLAQHRIGADRGDSGKDRFDRC
ncbi:hypothetical protein ACIO14_31675 [Nocardia fluminea]